MQRSGRRLFAQDSPSLQSAVGPGWQPWLRADRDCARRWPRRRRFVSGTAMPNAGAGRAGEAKIARALAAQLARHEQDQRALSDEALDDAGQWLQRIDALLQAGAARIGLLVRDYDGSVVPGSRSRRNATLRAHLAASDLLAFEPGTLHWIERG